VNGFTSAPSTVARNREGNNPLGRSFFVMAVTYWAPWSRLRPAARRRPGAPYAVRMRDDQGSAPPPPLVVAAGLVVLEGVLLLGYGVLEAANIDSARAAMGITTALFFVILATALIACGWLVVRGRAGARSPIVVAQVMFLGLAWSFRGGDTTWVAIGLAIVAVVVLAGLLHPASVDALTQADPHDGG
jgi:hypothetical protein